MMNTTCEATTNEYKEALQGVGTNLLAQLNGRYMTPVRNPLAMQPYSVKAEGLTVSAATEEILKGLRVSALKLLDLFCMAYKEKQEQQVSIPLAEYMRLCHGDVVAESMKKKCRRTLNEDLYTLNGVHLVWKERSREKNKGAEVESYSLKVGADAYKIAGGYIRFLFSDKFAAYLDRAYVMQYPLALLGVDNRNASAYHIGRKLALHAGMYNNIVRGSKDCIGVSTLLKSCPSIPKYEGVRSTGRQFTQRIKLPFEAALDLLVAAGVLDEWEYCGPGKRALLAQEIAVADYATFKSLYIRFTMHGVPDQSERIKRNMEKRRRRSRKRK